VRDLLGIRAQAGGSFQNAKFGGRNYMVVPVVALVEGVIQGVTAEYPELALASEFGKFPAGWNGRPVVMNHPEVTDNGQTFKVSANSPAILEKDQFGFLFNTRADGNRLVTEAWIDVDRANRLSAASRKVIADLKAGKTCEVSTGLFTGTHKVAGYRGSERYEAVWEGVVPDHLAFLPEGTVGACSVEDGCGAARQNGQYVTLRANCDGNLSCGCPAPEPATLAGVPTGVSGGDDAGSVTAPGDPAQDTSNVDTGKNKRGKKKKKTDTGTYNLEAFDPGEFLQSLLANQGVPDGMLDSDVRSILQDECEEEYPGAMPYVIGFTPTVVVYSVYDSMVSERYIYQAPFSIDQTTKEATIDLSQAVEVTLTTTITPASESSETTDNLGLTLDAGSLSANAGNPASADNTREKETSMTTAPKPGETPAASTTQTPVTAISHAAAAGNAPTPTPGAATSTPAAEPAVPSPTTSQQPAPTIKVQTADEYISQAPPAVREALQSAMRTHEAQKAHAIQALIGTKRCAFSEADLKAMSLEQLEKLVQLAAVPDYSGLGGQAQAPRAQAAGDFSGYAPPPPRLGVPAAAPAAPASTATH
jgi:hypothetical protein